MWHFVVITSLLIIWRIYESKEQIIHYIVSTLVHPIRDDDGRLIPGPQWKFADGQGLDKFLQGYTLSKMWRKHGPVYRIWSGLIPEIVLTKPEDVRSFHNDSPLHVKSTSSNGGWLFHQLLGECMGLINGEPWKSLRAEFHPYFIHRAVTEIAPRLELAAASYLQQLTASCGNDPMRLHAANTARFPFMTTAEYLYGPLNDDERNQLWSLGQRSLSLMGNVLSGGVYRYKIYQMLKPRTHQIEQQFEHDWTEFNDKIYNSRKSGHFHLQPRAPIVQIWDSLLASGCPKRMLIQTMSEILFANLDVSTHVLGWIIIYIARNQHIQQQLREELDDSAKNNNMTAFIFKKDTLLHLCLLESLRLQPFTAFTIPESSPLVKVLGGFTVPPYTSVVVDTVAINHNAAFWGNDSLEFNPHRLRNLSSTELRYNLFTFGFGTRKCLGQYFAEAMVKQFLLTLLQTYQLEIPETEILKGSDTKQDVDTWVPISDIQVTLTRRN